MPNILDPLSFPGSFPGKNNRDDSYFAFLFSLADSKLLCNWVMTDEKVDVFEGHSEYQAIATLEQRCALYLLKC